MGEIQTVSNVTRARKSEPYTEIGALKRWVSEYAEAHNMTEEEVVALALFRLERERIDIEKECVS